MPWTWVSGHHRRGAARGDSPPALHRRSHGPSAERSGQGSLKFLRAGKKPTQRAISSTISISHMKCGNLQVLTSQRDESSRSHWSLWKRHKKGPPSAWVKPAPRGVPRPTPEASGPASKGPDGSQGTQMTGRNKPNTFKGVLQNEPQSNPKLILPDIQKLLDMQRSNKK